MFKRLRVRFIALSMASLLLVLGVILGAANLIAYRHVVQNADEILDILAANGGAFPKPEGFGNEENNTAPAFPMEPGQPGVWSEGETQPEPPSEAEAQPSSDTIHPQPGVVLPDPPTDGETLPWETPEVVWQSAPDEDDLSNVLRQLDADEDDDADDDDASEETAIRDRNAVRRQEMPYESRFFTVTVNDAGDVLSVDTGKIAAVDMADAVEYAQEALESGKERGFIDDYRWRKADTEDGALLLFLDCGRNLDTFRSFLLTSLAVSALGLLAVFLLILAFSGRVVRPVAESYEKQKRFITDAGHEIKTPLAIIEADADVLEMELEGESEWLSDIRLQTRRLTDLTNDLVYLSRMEERADTARFVDFPLSDVVDETAQSFHSRAMQKRQTFTGEIERNLTLHGDEKAIRQLVSILLDNAVKYAPEDGVIRLRLARQGKYAALSVWNTTETRIPRESLDQLFDRFYRTDPSRSSETGGHGIGLSIAKAVVSAHRGKITAETDDEQSLRITALLPLGN
jgi:signal transduction histidine kinase